MSDRIITTAGPTLSGPEIEYAERQGSQTVYSWEGTYAECIAQREICIAGRASSVRLSPSDGGLWKVSATYAGSPVESGGQSADQPVNLHEIDVQVEQIPIWKSKRLRDYTSLSDDDISIVKCAVEKYLSNSPLYDTGGVQITNPTRANFLTAMIAETTEDTKTQVLFKRALSQESVFEYRSVYRRSITAATWAQVQASYTGVAKIWTSAEVEAFEGVPTNEWFGLPTAALWLKAPPNVRAVAYGKTEISYYYSEIIQPSKYFYEAYGSATMLD